MWAREIAVGKNTRCQAYWPEFEPGDLYNKRTELTYTHIHRRTHTPIWGEKEKKNK